MISIVLSAFLVGAGLTSEKYAPNSGLTTKLLLWGIGVFLVGGALGI